MKSEISPDAANDIISRAIDRAAVDTGLAREGHSPSDGISRFVDPTDDESVFEAQEICESCFAFICGNYAAIESEEQLSEDAYNDAVAYISARKT